MYSELSLPNAFLICVVFALFSPSLELDNNVVLVQQSNMKENPYV